MRYDRMVSVKGDILLHHWNGSASAATAIYIWEMGLLSGSHVLNSWGGKKESIGFDFIENFHCNVLASSAVMPRSSFNCFSWRYLQRQYKPVQRYSHLCQFWQTDMDIELHFFLLQLSLFCLDLQSEKEWKGQICYYSVKPSECADKLILKQQVICRLWHTVAKEISSYFKWQLFVSSQISQKWKM